MKKLFAGKIAVVEMEKVVRELSRDTGNRHALHVVIQPVINNDGDFLASEVKLLENDSVEFRYLKQVGNPSIIEIRLVRNGDEFFAEAQQHDFTTNFLGV